MGVGSERSLRENLRSLSRGDVEGGPRKERQQARRQVDAWTLKVDNLGKVLCALGVVTFFPGTIMAVLGYYVEGVWNGNMFLMILGPALLLIGFFVFFLGLHMWCADCFEADDASLTTTARVDDEEDISEAQVKPGVLTNNNLRTGPPNTWFSRAGTKEDTEPIVINQYGYMSNNNELTSTPAQGV
uniref:Uncharacterized protein n=1 Tax=Branchiostoma floridae TaxID=7739 RepID=C3YEK0_BRAFL|eukprot:XP_002605292.1 hypothetical protein BRAFLDRAFT_127762 [Branchiostoma floridae]